MKMRHHRKNPSLPQTKTFQKSVIKCYFKRKFVFKQEINSAKMGQIKPRPSLAEAEYSADSYLTLPKAKCKLNPPTCTKNKYTDKYPLSSTPIQVCNEIIKFISCYTLAVL